MQTNSQELIPVCFMLKAKSGGNALLFKLLSHNSLFANRKDSF